MNTRFKFLTAAVLSILAICSCDKSELPLKDGNVTSKSIAFGKVQVCFPMDTKAGDSEPRKVGEINDGDVSFIVEETVSSIDSNYQTKADATTTSSLGNFKVHGYLDSEIKDKPGASDQDKNNLYFIPGAEVTGNYSGTKWVGDFSEEYNWRFGTHHHFWATPNNLSLNIDQDTFDNAGFSYTSNGNEDVILAYTNRYFGKDEDTSGKDPNLSLTFKHALAAVRINAGNLVFKKRSPSATDNSGDEDAGDWKGSPRCVVNKYEVRGINDTGDCETDGTDFTWDNLSLSPSSAAVNLLVNNEYNFVIPQERYKEDDSGKATTLLYLEVIDRQRSLTRPFIYETSVFGTGAWQAGHCYQYAFSGKIIVPDLPEDQEGIDAGFAGKDFQSLALIEGLAGKYIKKVKLTWTGLPGGNSGNGTFVWLSLEDSNYTPLESDYMGSGQTPITARPQIGFVYDYKTSTVKKGNVDGTTCSCDITIDENAGDLNLYAVYIGANNSGTCEWNLSGLTMEILEWR